MPTLLEVGASLLLSFILSETLSFEQQSWSPQRQRWCVAVIVCLLFLVCVGAFVQDDYFWTLFVSPDHMTVKILVQVRSQSILAHSYFVAVLSPAMLTACFGMCATIWFWARKRSPEFLTVHARTTTRNCICQHLFDRTPIERVGLLAMFFTVLLVIQALAGLPSVLTLLEYGAAAAIALTFIFCDMRGLLAPHKRNDLSHQTKLSCFIIESFDIVNQFWPLVPISIIICSSVLVLLLVPLTRMLAGGWATVDAVLHRRSVARSALFYQARAQEWLKYAASRGALYGPFAGLHALLKRRMMDHQHRRPGAAPTSRLLRPPLGVV